jgi:hypothetical protein
MKLKTRKKSEISEGKTNTFSENGQEKFSSQYWHNFNDNSKMYQSKG